MHMEVHATTMETHSQQSLVSSHDTQVLPSVYHGDEGHKIRRKPLCSQRALLLFSFGFRCWRRCAAMVQVSHWRTLLDLLSMYGVRGEAGLKNVYASSHGLCA